MKFEFGLGTNEFSLSDVILKNNLYSLSMERRSCLMLNVCDM